jgi:hypothetical protein
MTRPRRRPRHPAAALAAAVGLLFSIAIPASCESDCRGKYEQDMAECRAENVDSGDAQDLRDCLSEAKETYQNCLKECHS